MANSNEKLREALELMTDLFDKGVICTSYANTPEEIEQIEELYRKSKAALSGPPRQCDVGTSQEQARRYQEFCDSQDCDCIDCPAQWRTSTRECPFVWAQMPYKEGGEK